MCPELTRPWECRGGFLNANGWVSSDILITLMHDLTLDERGLVQNEQLPVWQYPDNYIEKLSQVLSEKISE